LGAVVAIYDHLGGGFGKENEACQSYPRDFSQRVRLERSGKVLTKRQGETTLARSTN